MVAVNTTKDYNVAFIFTLKFIESLLTAVLSGGAVACGLKGIVKIPLSFRGVTLQVI